MRLIDADYEISKIKVSLEKYKNELLRYKSIENDGFFDVQDDIARVRHNIILCEHEIAVLEQAATYIRPPEPEYPVPIHEQDGFIIGIVGERASVCVTGCNTFDDVLNKALSGKEGQTVRGYYYGHD